MKFAIFLAFYLLNTMEWVKGQNLGFCDNSSALWSSVRPKFEDAMKAVCPYKLDLHQYAGPTESPNIHKYLQDASKKIYKKMY